MLTYNSEKNGSQTERPTDWMIKQKRNSHKLKDKDNEAKKACMYFGCPVFRALYTLQRTQNDDLVQFILLSFFILVFFSHIC